jgi:hypothetical protein
MNITPLQAFAAAVELRLATGVRAYENQPPRT